MDAEGTKQTLHGDEADQYWRGLLMGEGKGLAPANRLFRRIPTSATKLCQAPFYGPYGPIFCLAGFRRWALNQVSN